VNANGEVKTFTPVPFGGLQVHGLSPRDHVASPDENENLEQHGYELRLTMAASPTRSPKRRSSNKPLRPSTPGAVVQSVLGAQTVTRVAYARPSTAPAPPLSMPIPGQGPGSATGARRLSHDPHRAHSLHSGSHLGMPHPPRPSTSLGSSSGGGGGGSFHHSGRLMAQGVRALRPRSPRGMTPEPPPGAARSGLVPSFGNRFAVQYSR